MSSGKPLISTKTAPNTTIPFYLLPCFLISSPVFIPSFFRQVTSSVSRNFCLLNIQIIPLFSPCAPQSARRTGSGSRRHDIRHTQMQCAPIIHSAIYSRRDFRLHCCKIIEFVDHCDMEVSHTRFAVAAVGALAAVRMERRVCDDGCIIFCLLGYCLV